MSTKDTVAQEEKTPKINVIDRRHWAAEDGAETDEAPAKPSYVEELENKLQAAEQLRRETLEKHKRALSEFENARVRLTREGALEVKRHRRDVLIEMLDVFDNLDRALEASGESNSDGLRDGVAMVRDQFLAKLEGFDVKRVPSLGADFDPELHEAVSTVPVDADQDGKVVGVIKEAFTIGDETLRPAVVAVGRAAGEAPEGSGDTDPE